MNLKSKNILAAIAAALILTLGVMFLWLSPRVNRNFFDDRMLDGVSRLLIVFAHADDEVTDSGLIKLASQKRISIEIITLTDGRANPKSDKKVCIEPDMFDCRTRELKASAKNLGIMSILTPGLPDSKLSDHIEEGAELVSAELRAFRPQALLTMEPSGLNHHPDHMAAHQIAMKGLAKSGVDLQVVFLSTMPFPMSSFMKSDFPAKKMTLNRRHLLMTPELIRTKVTSALAHASQSATIRELTGGMGPKALFSWMDREAYFILQDDEIQNYLDLGSFHGK